MFGLTARFILSYLALSNYLYVTLQLKHQFVCYFTTTEASFNFFLSFNNVVFNSVVLFYYLRNIIIKALCNLTVFMLSSWFFYS